MALVGGDPEFLSRAASLMKPVASHVDGLARAVSAAGGQADAAAGDPVAASAVSGLAEAAAKAVGDTGMIVGHLGQVAELSAASLVKAGGTP
jgi:hypothetical protein